MGWEAPGKGLVFAVNLRWEVTWPILGYERRSHWLELREGGVDSHRGSCERDQLRLSNMGPRDHVKYFGLDS